MTPPQFSWADSLRALRHPGPPPPGLVGTGVVLLVLCLAAITVLIWLGHVWYDKPHRFFAERKIGTHLSVANLLATAVLSALSARRLGPVPFARFWRVAAVGFVWLACDDLFTFHEEIDRGVHALLGLDPEHPVTDHLDDLIVASYGVAAMVLAYRYRADLSRLTWMHLILAVGFALFTVMVLADLLDWSKALEESLKVVAGTLIFVGFLAARLQLAQPGRTSPPPLTHARRSR